MAAKEWRKTTQLLLPERHQRKDEQFELFPSQKMKGAIEAGFGLLSNKIQTSGKKIVLVDGYSGVIWNDFHENLTSAMGGGIAKVERMDDFMHSSSTIESMYYPFLGSGDPIFGFRTTLDLPDLFQGLDQIKKIVEEFSDDGILLVFGVGAGLLKGIRASETLLIYLDVPKNEIQYRSRAQSITNLGLNKYLHKKVMYKHFYFIEWPMLNRYRADLMKDIDIFVDAQRKDNPLFSSGDVVRDTISEASKNVLRVKPWFEPGVWGGQWLKKRIPSLPQDVPNYAWSFELIVWENGVIFEHDGYMLELSFDFLMFQEYQNVLGKFGDRFGYEFPIRFDYLDTVKGQNLSLQCHPRPGFIINSFGENFEQDETYYMTHSEPGAVAFCGFQDDIDPKEFEAALRHAETTGENLDADKFVASFPVKTHDLVLIPNGTPHCSGAGSVVLEISSTPYIFTFKMYDWQRLDLDGKPRPINIDRAMKNLRFGRRPEDLKAIPKQVRKGEEHLPTHPEHFYDVSRYTILPGEELTIQTNQSVHCLNVVEGKKILVSTQNRDKVAYMYLETFLVPSAASSYTLSNPVDHPVKVICSYMKPEEDTCCVIALDVGGTSVKSAVITPHKCVTHFETVDLNSHGTKDAVLETLETVVRDHLRRLDPAVGYHLAIGFPGPCDYKNGICQIEPQLNKFESLFGISVTKELTSALADTPPLSVTFENDANAAIFGEVMIGAGKKHKRVLGLTLGTGMGSCFIVDHLIVTTGPGVPKNGWLYNQKFDDFDADDIFSIRGLIARLTLEGISCQDVRELDLEDDDVIQVVKTWARDLCTFLKPFAKEFKADCILLAGGLSLLFKHFLEDAFIKDFGSIDVFFAENEREQTSALVGLAIQSWSRHTKQTAVSSPHLSSGCPMRSWRTVALLTFFTSLIFGMIFMFKRRPRRK